MSAIPPLLGGKQTLGELMTLMNQLGHRLVEFAPGKS
jgi:hypothetical protein